MRATSPGGVAPDPSRWRFGRLYAAPHRIAFAAAATMLGASGLWWAFAMIARSDGAALRWALPPSTAHGLLMTFGFMPLFFAGFLFTAGPRWLGVAPVDARDLAAPLLAQLAGWAVFLFAVHGPDAAFGAVVGSLGLGAVAFGWSSVWWRYAALVRASRVVDRTHPRLIAVAGGVGVLALWSAAVCIAVGDFSGVRAATVGALWLFVGIVFATVTHRTIPFFGAAAWPALDRRSPLWLLWSLVALFGAEGTLAMAEALLGALPSPLQIAQAAFELPAGIALLALALRWARVQNMRLRLLAMLHLGFVWLGVAFVLAGVSHALVAASGNELSLGLAPLHAYTMGFLASTMTATTTRVSSGHGGRAIAADDFVWRLFWVLQFAVLARVLAGVCAALGDTAAQPLVVAAAIAWGAVCVAWAIRYGRWYGTARADGRPG